MFLNFLTFRYAYLSKEKPDTVMNRFFGIFFFAFQLNNIIGQLISSFVLSSGNANDLGESPFYSKFNTMKLLGVYICN